MLHNLLALFYRTTQSNPFFNTETNLSYWGYKVIISCNVPANVTDVYIPIYENIESTSLTVSERVLSCGRFENVPYDFESPTGTQPPELFQFVHIPVDGRYTRANSIYYRFAIVGNFPSDQNNIFIQTSNELLEFEGDFLVAGEPPAPNLTLTKDSTVSIVNNQATINYTVTVTNTGNVTVGTMDVIPDTIVVGVSTSGLISLNGNIGNLTVGQSTLLNLLS